MTTLRNAIHTSFDTACRREAGPSYRLTVARVMVARSWAEVAAIIKVAGPVTVGSKRWTWRMPRELQLATKWCVYRRPWHQSSEVLSESFVVPTSRGDLWVGVYDAEVRVEISKRTRAEIRAERAADHRAYEERLSKVAARIADGTLRLIDVDDPPAGFVAARSGQEGGMLLWVERLVVYKVSLPGALRRAGVAVAEDEEPIDALRRALSSGREDHAIKLRGLPARIRRMKPSARAAYLE